MKEGVSICVVTLNTFFYNRVAVEMIRKFTHLIPHEMLFFDNGSTDGSREWLSEQKDVSLIKGSTNIGHGPAADILIQQAEYEVCCTLCSDAFPTSVEWLTPALSLYDGETLLAGVDKPWGRLYPHYICPSFFFGKTEFLRTHSFNHNWPQWDTGEKICADARELGGQLKLIPMREVELGGGFKPMPCDYSGLVWHTWYSTRRYVHNISAEVNAGYYEHMQKLVREKYKLTY